MRVRDERSLTGASRTTRFAEVRRERDSPSWWASSSLHDKDAVDFRNVLTMIETIRQNAKRESFSLRYCFVARGAVCEHSREIGHFPDPATVLFPFDFDDEVAHGLIVQRRQSLRKFGPPDVSPLSRGAPSRPLMFGQQAAMPTTKEQGVRR